jgi:hypothetical protein
MVLSLIWSLIVLVVVIIVIVVLLKLVFAVFAIGPVAIDQQYQEIRLIAKVLMQTPLES